MSASGILKSENVVSMSNKFPSHSFLFSYLNDKTDNVFAIGELGLYIFLFNKRA